MNYQKPLYIQLRELIIERINAGEYLPGEKLPSEREMSKIYKINRMTVKKAIETIVEEGILYKIKNKGTFVSKQENNKILYLNDHSKGKSIGLGAFINSTGRKLTNTVLEKGVIENSHYLEKRLNLNKNEEIYILNRLRSIEGESVALEYCSVPKKYFPDIDSHDFEKASLYDYMKSKNHFPVSFTQSMIIQKTNHPIDKIMSINDESFVYVLEYIGKDKEGNIVEFTKSYLRSDKAIYGFEIS
ncbi:MAG: GntR family transcriptional regulator [Sphaerochaetaceae bacterium]|nr:GntR family transcriptional regulator [Sphaerochaetaceae bacterium]MDC7237720.1 GntR family transcriptional regulator [Sphaerochaetaceae bacterium]